MKTKKHFQKKIDKGYITKKYLKLTPQKLSKKLRHKKPKKLYIYKKEARKIKAINIIKLTAGLTCFIGFTLGLPLAIAGFTTAALITLSTGAFAFATGRFSISFLRASIKKNKRNRILAREQNNKYEVSEYKSEVKENNKDVVIEDDLLQYTILPNERKETLKSDYEKDIQL